MYRACALSGDDYFLKVRRGAINEASLAVAHTLHDHGVARVVPSLSTAAGALRAVSGRAALDMLGGLFKPGEIVALALASPVQAV